MSQDLKPVIFLFIRRHENSHLQFLLAASLGFEDVLHCFGTTSVLNLIEDIITMIPEYRIYLTKLRFPIPDGTINII
jgi:hypothetical protein